MQLMLMAEALSTALQHCSMMLKSRPLSAQCPALVLQQLLSLHSCIHFLMLILTVTLTDVGLPATKKLQGYFVCTANHLLQLAYISLQNS